MPKKKRAEGGPAFPRPASEHTPQCIAQPGVFAIEPQDGMTLRDYFAAKTLVGILAGYPHDADWPKRDDLARSCYGYADAMLAERERHV